MEREDSEVATLETIEALLDGVVTTVDAKAMEVRALAFAVHSLVGAATRVAQWSALRRDASEPYAFESEPDMGLNDRWSRGLLQSKPRKFGASRCPQLDVPLSVASSQPNSGRSSVSMRRRRRKPAEEPTPPPLSIVEETLDPGLPTWLRAAEPRYDLDPLARLERKLDAEDGVVDNQIKALKGKKWTMDTNGDVIVLQTAAPSAHQTTLCYNIKDESDLLSEVTDDATVDTAASSTRRRRRERRRKHRQPAVEEDPSIFSQAPIVTPEFDFFLSAGVTVRQGKKSKAGAPLPSDPSHWSRADYQKSVAKGPLERPPSTRTSEDAAIDPPAKSAPRSLPGPDVDAFAGARSIQASRSDPALRKKTTDDLGDDDEALLRQASDRRPPLQHPVVARRHHRRSSRQLLLAFGYGMASHSRAARVRVAAARPTRKLEHLPFPPPGLSELGLSILRHMSEDGSYVSHMTASSSTQSLGRLPHRRGIHGSGAT